MPELTQPLPKTKAAKLDASRLPHGEANLTPLAQLRRLQRVLFDATQVSGVDNREAAQLACAWERLEGRKAILCMRPAPKPIDVSGDRRQRKGRSRSAVQPSNPVPTDTIATATASPASPSVPTPPPGPVIATSPALGTAPVTPAT